MWLNLRFPLVTLTLGRLEYQAKHKLLRLPPQSMSYELSHRLEDFCAASLIALEDYCLAIMFRFAYSERKCLADMAVRVQKLIGDNVTLEAGGRLIIAHRRWAYCSTNLCGDNGGGGGKT